METDITHQWDQMQAALRDMAQTLASYNADLKKAGFNNSQAFELTKEYQRITFSNSRK